MSIALPEPIERYLRIEASGTTETLSECFAPDATVRDEGKTHVGLAAIGSWMADTKRKYRHTITPLALSQEDDKSVLKARLTGSFPGGQITLRFGFVLAEGKIIALEIRS